MPRCPNAQGRGPRHSTSRRGVPHEGHANCASSAPACQASTASVHAASPWKSTANVLPQLAQVSSIPLPPESNTRRPASTMTPSIPSLVAYSGPIARVNRGPGRKVTPSGGVRTSALMIPSSRSQSRTDSPRRSVSPALASTSTMVCQSSLKRTCHRESRSHQEASSSQRPGVLEVAAFSSILMSVPAQKNSVFLPKTRRTMRSAGNARDAGTQRTYHRVGVRMPGPRGRRMKLPVIRR